MKKKLIDFIKPFFFLCSFYQHLSTGMVKTFLEERSEPELWAIIEDIQNSLNRWVASKESFMTSIKEEESVA